MAFFGSQEIILICSVIVMIGLPIVIIVAIVYPLIKGYREKQSERIKQLEARVSELEKEKAREERLNRIEKRLEERENK